MTDIPAQLAGQSVHEDRALKPCPNPWCVPSDGLPPTLHWNTEAYVECASCGMQGPSISPVVRDEDGERVGTQDAEAMAIDAWNTRPAVSIDQHLFTNMVRSLFNIDGYLLPELTSEHQGQFVRDPVRYFMGTDRAQQNAIFREVMKRQVRS